MSDHPGNTGNTTREEPRHSRTMQPSSGNTPDTTTISGRGTKIEDSPMMTYLLDALKDGKDIGHFGRLTFVMVARFFMPAEEIVNLLEKQPGMSELHAKALVLEVKERDYNPPKRDQILDWQERQSFPICPNSEDPRSCNVYDELQFPEHIYDNITHYYEQQVEAHEQDSEEQTPA